jgi:hypothetical protein
MAPNSSLVSHSVEAELTEFSAAFDSAFVTVEAPQWAQALGAFESTDNLVSVYPLDIGVVGYRPFEGDMKFRDMYAAELRMRQDQWQDGISVMAEKIRQKDWIGWGKRPTDMAKAARGLGNKLVAAVLAANPYLDFYTIRREGGNTASAIQWFASNHPVNLLDASKGTFGNDFTWPGGDLTDALVDAIKTRFALLKGPDGDNLGAVCRTFLVPAALGPSFTKFFKSDMLLTAVQNVGATENVGGVVLPNVHAGTVQVVVAPELDVYSTSTFYAIDEVSSVSPWILQVGTSPETIIHDESSHMYKTSLRVAIASILKAGAAGAFPHTIHRYVQA